ncbi:MAG: hypothetical protein AB7H96_14275 [Vicinamibacterales bacterium]
MPSRPAASGTRLPRPLFGALLLFGVLFVAVTLQVLRATDGHVGYALDDAYIHLAIARNVAQHGTWGINAGFFASASSSPLWTALLGALFTLTGVNDVIPLVLNLSGALALIVVVATLLRREGLAEPEQLGVLVALVLLAPMVPMVWIGMEHSLNNVFVVLAVWRVANLSRPGTTSRLLPALAWILLASATRLEGLFVAAGCGVVLVWARRPAAAAAVCAVAALPTAVVGLWNVSHGWFFLPASVMMKQTVLPPPDASFIGTLVWSVMHAYPPGVFVVTLVIALILLARHWRVAGAPRSEPWLVVFVTASVLHLGLARFGFLYRYESYLMVLGVIAIGMALHRQAQAIARAVRVLAPGDIVVAAAVVAAVAGNERTLYSNAALINTAGHIYRQQRQMGLFVARYYDRDAVALNDIGAVSYFANARVYDLAGLASIEVARARRAMTFDTAFINRWLAAGDVPLAVVYDFWYPDERRFYDRWVRVGRWITDNQDELTEGAVTFYAPDQARAERLRSHLRDFMPSLPTGVVVELTPPSSAAVPSVPH